MNYTPNHHLPQWVESDRVRMEDFNAAMRDIEAGLDAANASAASAKSTANSALAKANAAYAPGNLPYVIGTYTGDGSNQIIDLGFMPSFLIVSGMQGSNDASNIRPIFRYHRKQRRHHRAAAPIPLAAAHLRLCRLQGGQSGLPAAGPQREGQEILLHRVPMR